MLEIALAVVGVFAVVATALPLVRSEAWWIRAFEFPRAQIAILGLGAIVGLPALDGELAAPWRAVVALAGIAVAYQAWCIRPYSRLARREVEASRRAPGPTTLTLLVSNVLQTNRDAGRLLDLVGREEPDLVLLLETDEWWARATAPLRASHPHVVAHPIGNTYGLLLYSRLELLSPEVRFLVEDDVPSVHARVRLRGGGEVTLHGLHPRPPAPQENDRSTERDAELLLVAEAVRDARGPVVVAGDLNDVAWSRTTRRFQHISGLLDPRIGRGLYGTFPARLPFLRWPLDHVFHSSDFRLQTLRVLPSVGSDHLPVLVTLSHEPDAAGEQPRPQADAEEHQEAAETISKARTTADGAEGKDRADRSGRPERV